MKLELIRTTKTEKSTSGKLLINGVFFCYTLEDVERTEKIYGKTAIPTGTYKVIISYSPRFKKQMPLLLNVPNYLGVRIHTGNKAEDTEGCILVGETKEPDFIGKSKVAYKKLMSILNKASITEEITIKIS